MKSSATHTAIVIDHIRLTSAKPFDQVRADFERQLGKYDADVYRSSVSGGDAEAAKARIGAMAGSSGLMVFAIHEHGALLRIVGLTRKAAQYVVGNPLLAIQMTQHAIGAGLYAPLRVLLYENDEGQTCLESDRPSSLFGQFGDERVTQVAVLLDQKLEALATAAM